MAERVRVGESDDDEGQRLLRIIRRDSGSVVTWRQAQVVLPAAQGTPLLGLEPLLRPRRHRPRQPQGAGAA
ncbi:hypothetical protein OG923_25320 [Streptomyces halstedii]